LIERAQKPSLLLLVAIKDRKYFTQVSRHLEGIFPMGSWARYKESVWCLRSRPGKYGRGLADTLMHTSRRSREAGL